MEEITTMSKAKEELPLSPYRYNEAKFHSDAEITPFYYLRSLAEPGFKPTELELPAGLVANYLTAEGYIETLFRKRQQGHKHPHIYGIKKEDIEEDIVWLEGMTLTRRRQDFVNVYSWALQNLDDVLQSMVKKGVLNYRSNWNEVRLFPVLSEEGEKKYRQLFKEFNDKSEEINDEVDKPKWRKARDDYDLGVDQLVKEHQEREKKAWLEQLDQEKEQRIKKARDDYKAGILQIVKKHQEEKERDDYNAEVEQLKRDQEEEQRVKKARDDYNAEVEEQREKNEYERLKRKLAKKENEDFKAESFFLALKRKQAELGLLDEEGYVKRSPPKKKKKQKKRTKKLSKLIGQKGDFKK